MPKLLLISALTSLLLLPSANSFASTWYRSTIEKVWVNSGASKDTTAIIMNFELPSGEATISAQLDEAHCDDEAKSFALLTCLPAQTAGRKVQYLGDLVRQWCLYIEQDVHILNE